MLNFSFLKNHKFSTILYHAEYKRTVYGFYMLQKKFFIYEEFKVALFAAFSNHDNQRSFVAESVRISNNKEYTMAYEYIIFDLEDNIALIGFNRPNQLNALSGALLDEFSDSLDRIEDDENIRALILTGTGDKSFVAGADIKEISECNPLSARLLAEKGQRVISKLQSLSIPVIAAVNGYALGGGCEIVLACDFAYASETALLGFPEITLGIIPGFGGTQRLARLIGTGKAKEMIFTGNMISAAVAQEYGMINKVCARETLLDEVKKTAKTIASKGKVSVRAAKEIINIGMNTDLDTGLALEANAFAICMASQDAREGTLAFLEKRKPVFKGGFRG
jgi:enoyl-CoA hydratase